MSMEDVARELRSLLQARLESPWSPYDAARYADLCERELEAAREIRARQRPDEAMTRMAEVAAIRRAELDLNIQRMREEIEEREGFSALRAPRAVVRRAAPAT